MQLIFDNSVYYECLKQLSTVEVGLISGSAAVRLSTVELWFDSAATADLLN